MPVGPRLPVSPPRDDSEAGLRYMLPAEGKSAPCSTPALFSRQAKSTYLPHHVGSLMLTSTDPMLHNRLGYALQLVQSSRA